MKRPTQQDVATQAGVSRATVSYVLNGQAKGPISITEETRQKIFQAAEQLGYEPDAAAQSLRLQSSKTIGVLIPDTFNPHYWQMVRGVEDFLHSRNYDLLLTSVSLNPDRERAALRSLLRRRVDGLILVLTYADQEDRELKTIIRRRSPVVLLGEKHEAVDAVGPDEENGTLQLMQHLIDLGHRSIGLVFGVATPLLGANRVTIFKKKMREMKVAEVDQLVVHTGPTMQDGYQAALRLLDRSPRPTAILAINDLLAIGVLRACADRGLRVPDDISVAGFDDIDQAVYLNPALTTVEMNAGEMGMTAARLLFKRMENPDRAHEFQLIPTRLIRRASTGPAPAQFGGEVEGGGCLINNVA
jgi:LacI family transcriptional regulator